MKVALVCPYDWNAPGGVQVHIGELAQRLRSLDHEVVVLAPGRGQSDGVRFVGRPLKVRYAGTVAPIAPRSRAKVRSALEEFQPDVVHVHEPFTPSASMFATLVSVAPVVATFHAYLDRSRALTFSKPLLKRVFRKISASIAVSEAAASFSVRRFGGEPVIIPNGVEIERFGAAEPAADLPAGRRILWVNRLDPQKGFIVALRAFELLSRQLPDLSFIVAGDGPDRDAVDQLPPAARSRVVMLGNVPHEDLPPYLAGADVLVSPATGQESFGIVLVEAMAAGVPVVATDIPGYREVLRPDAEGFLVPAGNPIALGVAVRRILLDPQLAERLGRAGRGRAQIYSWDEVVPRIEAVYAMAASIPS